MKIEVYGRGFYWVASRSRPGLRHLVDIEEPCCSCEAHQIHFILHGTICIHLRAAAAFHKRKRRRQPKEDRGGAPGKD